MSAKRLFIPDDILASVINKANKDIRLLQYINTTTQENFDVFLTHHALVYILSGTKQIKVGTHKFDIHPGELFLIPRGEYVMSEYIAGENGFQSLMLFFSKRVVQDLIGQLSGHLPEHLPGRVGMIKKEAVKIIPHNRNIEELFLSLEAYSKSDSFFVCELIRLKFMELVYLLMDSAYQKLIISFLLDAVRGENPSVSSVLDTHLYSSATIQELAILSGKSLSTFKREFAQQYGEAPRGWIRRKKLERAAYLLETSDKTIDEVAELSGFVSAAHFARLYKEQYLLTPTEYRMQKVSSDWTK